MPLGIWFVSHFFARCVSQKTYSHARITRYSWHCWQWPENRNFRMAVGFFGLSNVQKRATKSDTSGHCLLYNQLAAQFVWIGLVRSNTGCFLVGCWSLWDATGLLEENMLPLLLYWLSSRAKKILMLVDIGQRRVTFFFTWNEIFCGIGKKLLQTKAALIASLHFTIIHWSLSKIWPGHRNKTACSELNPVQISRS